MVYMHMYVHVHTLSCICNSDHYEDITPSYFKEHL